MRHPRLAIASGLLLFVLAAGCPGCPPVGPDGGVGDAGPDGGPGDDGGPDGGMDAGVDGGPDGGADDDAGVDAGPGLDAFDVWRAVRDALRESDDHLPARADELVEAGDPEALFVFVRDAIATLPPSAAGFSGAPANQRWGTRATLRGGAGTPREKAGLLRALYERAGLAASVVVGTVDQGAFDPAEVVRAAAPQAFNPPLSDDEVALYRSVLGLSGPPEVIVPLDEDQADSAALAASLLPLAPAVGAVAFDASTLTQLPLVRVVVDGVPTYANPNLPGIAFGDAGTLAEPTPTSGANPPEGLVVRLEAARSDAPFDRFLLVERTWTADEVAGRRVHLGFVPAAPAEQLLALTPNDVDVFIPVLAVDGAGLEAAETEALRAVGDPVSRGGDRLVVGADDSVTLNGEPLGSGASDPATLASVTDLALSVQAGAFPRVQLRVSATDLAGATVGGLGADAFTVREEGAEVPFVLKQNQAPPPRVVLLVDASTSIPPEYRGAGAVDLANQILTGLYTAYPDAWVKVGTIFFGADFASTAWATDLATAQTQAAWLETATGSSELWQALADANDERPTVILVVTDGDANDVPEAEHLTAIAGGVPVLSVGVGTVNQAVLDEVSALSGGSSTSVAMPQDAVDAALVEIDARAVEDYLITYRADPEGPATRTVMVGVDDERVTAQATYEVPVSPAPAPALSGLYLTLRVGNREVTRTLAGYDEGYTTAAVTVPEADLDDVVATLFGRVTLAVEGPAPRASVWLTEWYEEKLRLEPLVDAWQAGDEAAKQAAVEGGLLVTPAALFLAATPVPQSPGTPLTYEAGLNVSTLVQKARFGVGWEQGLDLFALRRWGTAAGDPSAAYAQTLARSASLAVVEAGLFPTSTRSELEGLALRAFPSGSASSALVDLDPEVRARWEQLEDPFGTSATLILPDAGAPYAFWAVDEASGSLVGVLPDLSGGATRTELEANLSATNNLLDLVGQIGGLLGTGGAVGVWVELEKTKAALVTKATIVIATGEDPGGWGDPLLGLGCGLGSAGLGRLVPGLSGYFDAIGMYNLAGSSLGLGAIPAFPGCP